MAKLGARGRVCVVEAVREYGAEELAAADRLTVWERMTRRLMSDGVVLEKRDVRFRPSGLSWEDPAGERHTYAWKVRGKLKAGLTPADFTRIYQAPRKDGSASKWVVTMGATGAPAVVISQARIARAVESGESTGFCVACGAERDGCEPDARNYPCEACGAMAVYGAEELLMQSA